MAANGLLGILVGKAVAGLTGGEFRARKRINIGPRFWNLSWTKRKGDPDRGFLRSLIPRLTSQGYEVGDLTHNTTSGRTTYDTPGTGSVAWPRSRRRSQR